MEGRGPRGPSHQRADRPPQTPPFPCHTPPILGCIAQGMGRDMVLIICLLRTPLKLTRALVPEHLFPIPLIPVNGQQQYTPLWHLGVIAVAIVLLAALLQVCSEGAGHSCSWYLLLPYLLACL